MHRGLAGKAVLALILLAAAAAWFLWWRPTGPNRPVNFIVEQGASVSRVADDLHRGGLVANPDALKLYARLFGGGDPVQAGEFEIPARSSPAAILDLLQHGRPLQRLITVPEGMPSILVQERLAALPFATGRVPELAEGSVLPDSYTYERGEARSAIAERMQSAMAKALSELWAARTGDCPVANPREAVILASVVEKETGKPAERRTIAGVYCNRLKIGMKLDADPTVIYPVTKGKPLGRRIRRSELAEDNGYNTYRRPGLPAGPIANPGRQSIAAVLDPAPTKALYFVADGSGGHVFADTFAEHRANVEKWYALRRARGEM